MRQGARHSMHVELSAPVKIAIVVRKDYFCIMTCIYIPLVAKSKETHIIKLIGKNCIGRHRMGRS